MSFCVGIAAPPLSGVNVTASVKRLARAVQALHVTVTRHLLSCFPRCADSHKGKWLWVARAGSVGPRAPMGGLERRSARPPGAGFPAYVRGLLVVLGFGLLSGACGGSTSPDGAPRPPGVSTTPASLRSANDIRTETTVAGTHTLGDAVLLQAFVVTARTVAFPTPADMGGRTPSAPSTRWALISVRIENRATADTGNGIDWSISCGKHIDTFYVNDSDDALAIGATPPQSFDEGTVLIGIIDDCAGGLIHAAINGGTYDIDGPRTATWFLQ